MLGLLGVTYVLAEWHLIPFNGLGEMRKCTDIQTDGRKDHSTLTSVAITGIANAFNDAVLKLFRL